MKDTVWAGLQSSSWPLVFVPDRDWLAQTTPRDERMRLAPHSQHCQDAAAEDQGKIEEYCYILMARHKTAVTREGIHWIYHRFVLSHPYFTVFQTKIFAYSPTNVQKIPPSLIISYNFYLPRVKINWSSPVLGQLGDYRVLVLNTVFILSISTQWSCD